MAPRWEITKTYVSSQTPWNLEAPNRLASEGWELVSAVADLTPGGLVEGHWLYFKRPLED